jgi:hypothetical protein
MEAKKVFKRDYAQTKILVKAGRISAKNAIRRSKALNQTITYIDKGVIFKEMPNGSKEIIGTVEPVTAQVKLKKGMILLLKS